MYTNLHVVGDVTEWTITDADATAVLQAAEHGQPVVVSIVEPFVARLILSTKVLGAVILAPIPADRDWMPSYTHAPESSLYLPSTNDAHGAAATYRLAVGTDLTDLENKLVAAMHHGHRIEVPLLGGDGNIAVVNGATLPLAALLPPA